MLVEDLDLIPGPVRLSEKLEAGFDRGVITEAIDLDAEGEVIPAVFLDEVIEHPF